MGVVSNIDHELTQKRARPRAEPRQVLAQLASEHLFHQLVEEKAAHASSADGELGFSDHSHVYCRRTSKRPTHRV